MRLPKTVIESVANDPIVGVLTLIDFVQEELAQGDPDRWSPSEHELLLEAAAILMELNGARVSDVPVLKFGVTGDRPTDCGQIWKSLQAIKLQLETKQANFRFQRIRESIRPLIGAAFSYEFSDGDLKRVQGLINELRAEVASCTELEDGHKQRLLKRLEKMQSELHKKVSDLDAFWGMLSEAGVVMRKLGKDAKPIVDRMREIAQIAWATQARAEELPSGTEPPMLPQESEHKQD